MVHQLLSEALKSFSCDAGRGFGCECGHSDERAELVLLKEEKRMDDRLK